MIEAAMWRVKYAEGNAPGTGSGGTWKYYEGVDYANMEADILEALLNCDCGDGRLYHRTSNRLSRILRRHRSPELDEDSMKWRRLRVLEVAYLDGDRWVPVEVSWTPPSVTIGRDRDT